MRGGSHHRRAGELCRKVARSCESLRPFQYWEKTRKSAPGCSGFTAPENGYLHATCPLDHPRMLLKTAAIGRGEWVGFRFRFPAGPARRRIVRWFASEVECRDRAIPSRRAEVSRLPYLLWTGFLITAIPAKRVQFRRARPDRRTLRSSAYLVATGEPHPAHR